MIGDIGDLERRDLSLIDREAMGEGPNMVRRLIADYRSGENRFNGHGERLIGYWLVDQIVGVCGLSIEPTNGNRGRIRRLYLSPTHRNQGTRASLVKALLDHAQGSFEAVVVNIGELPASGFYESLGLAAVRLPSFTHLLILSGRRT